MVLGEKWKSRQVLQNVPHRDYVKEAGRESCLPQGTFEYLHVQTRAGVTGHAGGRFHAPHVPAVLAADLQKESGGTPHIQQPPPGARIALDPAHAPAKGPHVILRVGDIVAISPPGPVSGLGIILVIESLDRLLRQPGRHVDQPAAPTAHQMQRAIALQTVPVEAVAIVSAT
jgi:hypothetical protein